MILQRHFRLLLVLIVGVSLEFSCLLQLYCPIFPLAAQRIDHRPVILLTLLSLLPGNQLYLGMLPRVPRLQSTYFLLLSRLPEFDGPFDVFDLKIQQGLVGPHIVDKLDDLGRIDQIGVLHGRAFCCCDLLRFSNEQWIAFAHKIYINPIKNPRSSFTSNCLPSKNEIIFRKTVQ